MSMVKKSILFINRLACAILYGYCIYKTNTRQRLPEEQTYAGPWKYLTVWNLCIHLGFYLLSLLCDLFPYLKQRDQEKSARALLYHGLVVPLGIHVFTFFWAIYFFDRELVYPRRIDKIVPQWFNHACHTVILPACLLEGYLHHHPLPQNQKGLKLLAIIQTAYAAWITFIGIKTGHWVYPIITVLPLVFKFVFIAVSWLFSCSFYYAAEKYHELLWKKKAD